MTERVQYMDAGGAIPGSMVEVFQSFNGWWMSGRPSEHGHHRVKSPALPPRPTAEIAQADLDAYAAKKKWLRVVL